LKVIANSSPLDRHRSLLEWLVPALFCCILAAELFFSVGHLSQTADEATHLYSGYRYLKCGDLTVSTEHPPLARVVAATPLLLMNPPIDCSSTEQDGFTQSVAALNWLYSTAWHAELMRARMAISVFAIGLCILIWVAARRIFGFATAVTAGVLLVFEPNVLAHGAMVRTDMAVTATLFLATFVLYCWSCRPSTPLCLLAGLAAGLAILAKHSGVIVIPMFVTLLLVDLLLPREGKQRLRDELLRNLRSMGLICLVAFAVVWMGYGMRYAELPEAARAREPASTLSSASSTGRALLALEKMHALPRAYVEGFGGALSVMKLFVVNSTQAQMRAQWHAPPRILVVRTTMAFLILAALSLPGIYLLSKQYRRPILYLSLPALIYLAAFMSARWNGGVRHLLPIFPFLLILVAAGCTKLARHWQWMKYAVPCLLLFHAGSSVHAFPNYLSYGNELWGGPRGVYKHLGGQDLGQSYLQVRDYIRQHPSQHCWLLSAWQWLPPQLSDVQCEVVGPFVPRLIPPRMAGTVIISSRWLTASHPQMALAVKPFQEIAPTDYIGGSAMLVFRGDFDTSLASSVSATWLAGAAVHDARYGDAVPLANYALRWMPNNLNAMYLRAEAYANLGQASQSLRDLEEGRALCVKDPACGAVGIRKFDAMLQQVRSYYGSSSPALRPASH